MPKYTPITKTLKKAEPTIRVADDIVKQWEIEVVYSYAGNDSDLPAWKTTYSETEDVEYMNKKVDQFTKTELVAMMPPNIENHIFEAHYESQNMAPTETRKQINLSDIPD